MSGVEIRSSEETMILDSVDKFLERDVRPVARELEASDTYPQTIVCLLYTSPSPRDRG